MTCKKIHCSDDGPSDGGTNILAKDGVSVMRTVWTSRRALLGTVLLIPSIERALGRSKDYPTRSVTMVAPSAAGGLTSQFARLIGLKLEPRLGQPFVVENRPGTVIATVSVINAAPDGHTILINSSSGIAISATMHKNPPYDPLTDLAPVAAIAGAPQVLVVNATLPVRSLEDLAKLAKAEPTGLTFASTGAGTSQHLYGELLKSVLGINMTHVPYKGAVPALTDVAAGHIALMFSDILNALPMVQAGKLRMIGVATRQRVEAVPEIPSLGEMGASQFDAPPSFIFFVPAKTPTAIVDLLNAEIRSITSNADIRGQFVRFGLVPIDTPGPDELRVFMRSEVARWSGLVQKAGLAGSV